MKRKNIFRGIGVLVFSLLTVTSCSNFEDLNRDPSRSNDMDPNLILPALQLQLNNNFEEWHRVMIYPGGFVQQWCGDWAVTNYGCQANMNTTYFYEIWIRKYRDIIKNVVDIIERTKDDDAKANINALARILKVYVFCQLTDMYGDIPYSEAGVGYYEGILRPKYDKQEDIYNDFFIQLEQAYQQLNQNADNITYDHYFNGDIRKWKKFANSLRLRLAMRLVKVNPVKAQQEAEKAVSNGVMESNDDICLIRFENVSGSTTILELGNGLANRLNADGRYFRYSSRLIGYMESTADPRITIYGGCYLEDANYTDITSQIYAVKGSYEDMARPTGNFNWEGNPGNITITVDGIDVNVAGGLQLLQPSKWFMASDAPYIIMSYAEVAFFMAEAKLRGWNIPGTAEQYYEAGLRSSIEQMTLYGAPAVPDAAIDQFISRNVLVTGQEMGQINMQIWVGHVLNPYEAYANWRRTNIPDLTYLEYMGSDGTAKTPRRILYPSEEQVSNPDNYNEAVGRVSGYDWTVGVWWDK